MVNVTNVKSRGHRVQETYPETHTRKSTFCSGGPDQGQLAGPQLQCSMRIPADGRCIRPISKEVPLPLLAVIFHVTTRTVLFLVAADASN